MVEILQDELYQLEKKQAKDPKPCANTRCELKDEKCWKTFYKVFKDKNLQNQTMFELYTDDNKTKYSNNPKENLKSAKKCYERICTQETT